jgi:hypothetical protein
MGLRSAAIADAYRKLPFRNYSSSLSSAELTLSNGGTIRNAIANFMPGVSVITGGNGAGKTTVLQGIHALLTARGDTGHSWPARLDTLKISGTNGGEDWSVLAHRPSHGEPIELEDLVGVLPAQIQYIDPSDDTLRFIAALRVDNNAADLTSGLDPAPLASNWLEMLSMIVRKDYDEVLCYEIPSFEEGDQIDPWFVAKVNGITYDSLGMGRGELSAAYLVWRISQMRTGSIVILEEPENHLASHSQATLMDVLVHLSVTAGLSFVISSHSPEMFQKLPDGRVSLVSSVPELSVANNLSSAFVARALGLPMKLGLALIAEDIAAGHLATKLIESIDSPLLDAVEIFFAADGESGVRNTSRQIRSSSEFRYQVRRLPFVGVLDGDQKVNRTTDDGFVYLPGTLDPETVLRALVVPSAANDAASEIIGIANLTKLRLSLERAAGSETHDWLRAVSGDFGGMSQALDVMLMLCFEDASFNLEAREFVDAIRALVTV